MTFHNSITREEINQSAAYITGGASGGFSGSAYFFAPAGGTVGNFASESPVYIREKTYHDLALGYLQSLYIGPGQSLTITYARQRMLYGRTSSAMASRFLKEIPEECIVKRGGYHRAYEGGYSGFSQPGTHAAPQRRPKPVLPTASVASSAPCLELNQGDMVMHAAFGRGLVLSVQKMGGDALLEIAFDDIGTKKLMAKTASAHMKKL